MAEPMIKLDPHGSAPVVDYRLPDSTSYAGRHYIVLDLPNGAFRPELALEDSDAGRVRDVPGKRSASALEMPAIPVSVFVLS